MDEDISRITEKYCTVNFIVRVAPFCCVIGTSHSLTVTKLNFVKFKFNAKITFIRCLYIVVWEQCVNEL